MYKKYFDIPTIDIKKHSSLIVNAWNVLADDYNRDAEEFNEAFKEHKDFARLKKHTLKGTHYEIFWTIVRLLAVQLSENAYILKSQPDRLRHEVGKPFIVHTNNYSLGLDAKRSKASINRLLNRLIAANVILKRVNHGRNHDLELLINPDVLPVTDAKSNILLVPKIFKTCSESALKKFKTSLCEVSTWVNLNNINKKMDVDKSTSDKEASTEADFDNNQNKNQNSNLNTGKYLISETKANLSTEKLTPGANQKQKGSGVANKVQTVRNDWKYNAAKLLLDFAISLFWSGRLKNTITEVYESQYDDTLMYIADNYFEHIPPTAESVQNTLKNFTKRLEMSQRFIKRKLDKGEYQSWYVTPLNYFKLSNPKGFAGTRAWFMQEKEKKQEFDTSVKNRVKLQQAIAKVRANDYNIQTIHSRLTYLNKVAPHLVEEFCNELGLKNPAKLRKSEPAAQKNDFKDLIKEQI